MPRPAPYQPSDYPPQYRPVAPQSTPEPLALDATETTAGGGAPDDGPREAAAGRGRRRRWQWIGLPALLLATIAVHAGIATIELDHHDSRPAPVTKPAASSGSRCKAPQGNGFGPGGAGTGSGRAVL